MAACTQVSPLSLSANWSGNRFAAGSNHICENRRTVASGLSATRAAQKEFRRAGSRNVRVGVAKQVRCVSEPRVEARSADEVLATQPSFLRHIADHGAPLPFTRRVIDTVQVNIGLYCNQACQHCHVDSSPLRTEMMDHRTAERVVDLIAACPTVRCVDLTGGAPELNPEFRYLVTEARRMGKEVIDRCNLTVLFEPGQEDLGEFLAANQVHVVASLPCYSADNVNKQRGGGVFDLSIKALQRLNSLGYGKEGSGLVLDLVYNPVGPSLPPAQAKLQEAYKSELMACYGISFNSLFTITNMPVKRFASFLHRGGQLESYMQLLVNAFNPAAVGNVMCQNLINIDWQGALFDCDFNQQLNLGLPPKPATTAGSPSAPPRSVFDIESLEELVSRPIATGAHCYGCTAGTGSSCTGTVV
ncbi:hypothetical protein CLOP_g9501 [Closterium sp. NIES-67]|nr:hypothetical protein CLOP_g9501 [Closterium sp. NIES-67]